MVWVRQQKNEHTACGVPPLRGPEKTDVGDIWKCDDCGQHWLVRSEQIDGPYWQAVDES